MAKWCFSLGMVRHDTYLQNVPDSHGESQALSDFMCFLQNFKRIETIEDDEGEIIEAIRRMSDQYDFVVTRYDLILKCSSK